MGRAIDFPIEELPAVDEHSVEISAPPERVWSALAHVVSRSFSGPLASRIAGGLGCSETRATGDPTTIGSTIPGFVVARSIRPATLALEGEHRFSRYALIFRIDDLGGRCRLRAETRAEFAGRRGSAYRALVIGIRGHVLVVRRLLGAVRRRAESG